MNVTRLQALSIAIAIAALTSGRASAETKKTDADITAADGVKLKVSYFSPGRPGPGMLLLHQCNMDRKAWDGLAKNLSDAGIHVVTLDFRGFGESGGEKLNYFAALREVIPQKFPPDVDTAYKYLLDRPGVDKAHVAAGGASCGVEQAARLASRRPEIKTLMLLSGTAGDAVSYIAQTPTVAVFGAASDEDKMAAEGIKAAVGASKNRNSVLKIYAGTEHGVPMFAKNAELEPTIISWLKAQLASTGPTR